jgi:hypothetical protein
MNGGPRAKDNPYSVQTMADRGDLRPIPDPTVLTTQAQTAAIAALREILEMRLDGMDKAVILVKEDLLKFPTMIEAAVGSLEKLINEKLGSINNQFTLRDVAVAAALKAAQEAVFAQQVANKEANNKMESGFVKLFDQNGERLEMIRSGLAASIDDIKERLLLIEGMKAGSGEHKASTGANFGYMIGALGVVCLVVEIIMRMVHL